MISRVPSSAVLSDKSKRSVSLREIFYKGGMDSGERLRIPSRVMEVQEEDESDLNKRGTTVNLSAECE